MDICVPIMLIVNKLHSVRVLIELKTFLKLVFVAYRVAAAAACPACFCVSVAVRVLATEKVTFN
jgi:hypothetical protein